MLRVRKWSPSIWNTRALGTVIDTRPLTRTRVRTHAHTHTRTHAYARARARVDNTRPNAGAQRRASDARAVTSPAVAGGVTWLGAAGNALAGRVSLRGLRAAVVRVWLVCVCACIHACPCLCILGVWVNGVMVLVCVSAR